MELTEAIRSFIEKKMESLEPKTARFGTSVSTEVEVSKTTRHHKQGEVFRAEVHVRLPGNTIYAEATSEDLYVALNDAYKEATRQVLAYKGLLSAKKKRGARKAKRSLHGDDDAKGGRVLEEGI